MVYLLPIAHFIQLSHRTSFYSQEQNIVQGFEVGLLQTGPSSNRLQEVKQGQVMLIICQKDCYSVIYLTLSPL